MWTCGRIGLIRDVLGIVKGWRRLKVGRRLNSCAVLNKGLFTMITIADIIIFCLVLIAWSYRWENRQLKRKYAELLERYTGLLEKVEWEDDEK